MITYLSEILNIVLPVFLVVGLGYGIKHSTLLNDSFVFQLNKLAYCLAIAIFPQIEDGVICYILCINMFGEISQKIV
jgi:hypothetical protein